MVARSNLNKEVGDLRLDILPPETKAAFVKCSEMPLFQTGGWYLAGGTALAIQTGHRKSLDLDFFTREKEFDGERIERQFTDAGIWKTTSMDRGTLYGEFMKGKISLIAYPSFSPADNFLKVGTVSVLTPKDIAAMKIIAISQRGKKRDFFDLYWLSLNVLPLEESLKRAENQYSVRHNFTHILKSLVYFKDAEDDPDPEINFDVDWKKVKSFFEKEIPIILRRLIG